MKRVFVGYDPREQNAYDVCFTSLQTHAHGAAAVFPLVLRDLRARGLYTRKHEIRDGQLWDVISDAPMSTEFAISRFLVPHLCEYQGWAVYCDCDFLWRADVAELFELADPAYAVMVVKHKYITPQGPKMDGQINTSYPMKNWSSLMLFNCGHPANKLNLDYVNSARGISLHSFVWLDDHLIGSLPFEWNWLDLKPKAVHMTHGTPDMPGHENTAYADEWRRYL